MKSESGSRWNVASEMQSRSDIGSGQRSTQAERWMSLLGEPTRESRPSRWGRISRVNNQLPDEYVGENLFLARQLEGLNNNMGDVFVTEIYPMVVSDHVGQIEWSTWEFNRGVFHQQPWEGVPHLFTTRRKRRSATVHRKGGALKFEGDDLMSAKGREEYNLKFLGLSSVMIETYSLDTLRAIFRGIATHRRESEAHNPARLDPHRRIAEEKRRFAIFNKQPEAAAKVFEETRQMLLKRGVTGPFVILAPPGTINMLRLDAFPGADTRRDSQLYGADGGQGYLERRSDVPRLSLGNGLTVLEVPDLLVEQAGIPSQPLSRNVLTGSYMLQALPDDMMHADFRNHPYSSNFRAIRVKSTHGGYRTLTLYDTLLNADFPNMGVVTELIKGGSPSGGSWSKADFDPSLDGSGDKSLARMGDSSKCRRAHMMMFWDDHHSPLPVRYLGQMDENVLPTAFLHRMGEAAARNCGVSRDDVNQVQALIHKLRMAPGSDDFFKRLARTNLKYSVNKAKFVGEKLSASGAKDIMTDRGLPDLIEWTPQATGTLELPEGGGLPAGYASYAGIKAIASASSKTGIPQAVIDMAANAEVTLQSMFRALQKSVKSLATDPKSRSEWFHNPDPIEAMVQMLFTGPQDPLFLGVPNLKSSGAGKNQKIVISVPLAQTSLTINDTRTLGVANDIEKVVKAMVEGSSLEDSMSFEELALKTTDPAVVLAGRMETKAQVKQVEILNTKLNGVDVDVKHELYTAISGMKNNDNRAYLVAGLNVLAEGKTTADIKTLIVNVLGGKNRNANGKRAITLAKEAIEKGREALKSDPGDTLKALSMAVQAALSATAEALNKSDYQAAVTRKVAAKQAVLELALNATSDDDERVKLVSEELGLDADNYVDRLLALIKTSPISGGDFKSNNATAITGLQTAIDTERSELLNLGDQRATLEAQGFSKDDDYLEDSEIYFGTPEYYFRAPIVVTPGVVASLKRGLEYVKPGNPATGFTTPIKGSVPKNVLKRPSYIGADIHNIAHSVFHTTHAESFNAASTIGGSVFEAEEGAGSAFGSHFGDVMGSIGARGDYSSATDAVLADMYSDVHIGDKATPKDSWEYDSKPAATGFGADLHDYNEPNDYSEQAAQIGVSNVQYKLAQAKGIADPLERAMVMALIYSRCDKNSDWLKLESSGVPSPCVGMPVRPQLELVMGSMIMMKPGPETGMNIIGNMSTWVGGHANTKTVLVHVTHTAATITRTPKNIAPISNVWAQGIVSGGGVSYITSLEQMLSANPDERRDLLPIILPVTENNKRSAICATGYMHGRSPMDDYPHYSSVQYVNARLESDGLSLDDVYNQDHSDMYDDLVDHMASLPRYWLKSQWIDCYGEVNPSQEFRAEGTLYNGSERVWNGVEPFFSQNPKLPMRAIV